MNVILFKLSHNILVSKMEEMEKKKINKQPQKYKAKQT